MVSAKKKLLTYFNQTMIHTLQISHTSYHEFKMDNSDNITIYNDNFFTIVLHHFYLNFEEKK